MFLLLSLTMSATNASTLDRGSWGFFSMLASFTLKASKVLGGLFVIVAGLLYVKQDKLLYFPEIGGIPRRPQSNPRGYRSPEERQLPYESHMISCADGVQIHAWLLRSVPDSESAPTIVFFHGNAGNIGLRIPNAMQMVQYLNANVLMVEYRGYGNSDSVEPNEIGLKLDSQAALNYLGTLKNIDPNKIFIFGRSLGGSVAFHLAEYAERNGIPVAGVIVENTYTSISAMVDHLMPYLSPFKFLVLRISWDSAKIVPNITTPILFLAGARDELVPHDHMQILYDTARRSRHKHLHIIPDGTHNESWLQGGKEYWIAFANFMTAALSNHSPSSDTGVTSGTAGLGENIRSSIPTMSSDFRSIAKEGLRRHADANSAEPAKKEL
jgi:hypothetical protein